MKARITPPPQDAATYQTLVDHKQATLDIILAKIPETTTFAELGELLNYSHEWVRQRLVKQPEKLFKIGRRYQVPRGVAEEFVKSVLI